MPTDEERVLLCMTKFLAALKLTPPYTSRVLCQARGNASTMGLLVDSCDHTTIRNLTIYHAGSFAMFQTNGSNNTFMCGFSPATMYTRMLLQGLCRWGTFQAWAVCA